MICLPAQTGQPFPRLVRDSTLACHSWPLSQRHHTLASGTSRKVSGGQASVPGWMHWRPAQGAGLPGRFPLPPAYGWRRPDSRSRLPLSLPPPGHSWPFSQRHHTFRWLPGSTSLGVSAPFLVGCHWAASSGHSVAKSVSPGPRHDAPAKGAACVVAGPARHFCLPLMAFPTAPPHLLFTSIAHRLRGKRSVSLRIPLPEQLQLPGSFTVVEQCFAHGVLLR